jgi:hypothetical protein
VIRTLALFYAVTELPGARAFFTAALDVTFTEQQHLEQMTYLAATLPTSTVLELWPTGGGPVSRVQLEFAVPDLNSAAGRLSAEGFGVRRPAGTVLVVDPNRNTVALVES